MRYVILVLTATVFIAWESLYGDWVVTRSVLDEFDRVWFVLTR